MPEPESTRPERPGPVDGRARLLAALPPAALAAAREALGAAGTPLTVIGKVEAAEDARGRAEVRLPGGGAAPSRGYDQLRSRKRR